MSFAPPSDVSALQGLLAELSHTPRTARPHNINIKSLHDYVTDMDLFLEERLRTSLARIFPGVAVLGEETIEGNEALPPLAFIVDPLDGTGNWIAGLPFCSISVALVQNGQTILAAVADIYGNRVYGAQVGAGAWRDSDRIFQPASAHPLIALSTGLLDYTHATPQIFHAVRNIGKLRNLGSQALSLCFVADGVLGLSASIEARLWDDAAGRLIVTESRGKYWNCVETTETTIANKTQRSVAAHPALAREAQDLLQHLAEISFTPERHLSGDVKL